MEAFDPSRIWLYHERLSAIPEEMGAVLEYAACSPNIKERRDYSCALFDAQGRLIAQAAHIPVHLGAMPALMAYLLPRMEWQAGDMALTNDPYHAGTHLPDWTLLAPVFVEERLVGFVASRAHHADTGGATPGSMPLATEIYEEGLRIPPVKILQGGALNEPLLELILHNVRTPDERRGDLMAQIGANQVGVRRLQELLHTEGVAVWRERFEMLMRYSEQLMRAALRQIPPGEYEFVDYLDDDGRGSRDLPIRVRVVAPADGEGTVRFDFTGSAPQSAGGLNAPEAVTRAACYYVARCLLPEDAPTNDGCWRPIEVVAPAGTVVNAQPPRRRRRRECGDLAADCGRHSRRAGAGVARPYPRRLAGHDEQHPVRWVRPSARAGVCVLRDAGGRRRRAPRRRWRKRNPHPHDQHAQHAD